MCIVKPESVVYNGSLVELIARVQQLSGNDRSVGESRRLTTHFLTVDQDVFAMGPNSYRERKKLKYNKKKKTFNTLNIKTL